jgi:hypothetical protein
VVLPKPEARLLIFGQRAAAMLDEATWPKIGCWRRVLWSSGLADVTGRQRFHAEIPTAKPPNT